MDQEEIRSATTSCFKDQLCGDHVSQGDDLVSHILMMVTEEDNTLLSSFRIMDEVEKIAEELDANSTAGPDGFNAFFYQCCWDIIKAEFFDVVHEFFAGFEQPSS